MSLPYVESVHRLFFSAGNWDAHAEPLLARSEAV